MSSSGGQPAKQASGKAFADASPPTHTLSGRALPVTLAVTPTPLSPGRAVAPEVPVVSRAQTNWRRVRRHLIVMNVARRFAEEGALKTARTQNAKLVVRIKEGVSERNTVLVAEVKSIVSRTGSGLGNEVITITDEQLGALCNDRNLEALKLLGDTPAVARALKVDPATGLHPDSVEAQRARFGPNSVPKPPPRAFIDFVIDACGDRMLQFLFVAAMLSLVNLITDSEGGWHDAAAIVLAISIVVFASSYQDYMIYVRERATAALNDNIQITVIRGSVQQRVSVYDLVVGDVVKVDNGDLVPADGLLLSGSGVVCDESAMTGESDPLEKHALDKPFMKSGCTVIEGSGLMLVTGVGEKTEWGKIMSVVTAEEDEETPLQARLNDMVAGINVIGVTVAFIVFIVLFLRNVTTGSGVWYMHLIRAFIVGVTIVVVAVPEGLPLAVMLSLSLSSQKMLKDNVQVAQIRSCETMGGATTICSDKTGTLTANNMTVVRTYIGGVLSPVGRMPCAEDVPQAMMPLLLQAFFFNALESSTVEESADGRPDVKAKNPTERALLTFAAGLPGASYSAVQSSGVLLKLVPLNSATKKQGVVVRDHATGITRIFWKGASEIVLAVCTQVLGVDGKVTLLGEYERSQWTTTIDSFADGALRTLVYAYVELPASQALEAGAELPFEGLTLIALTGIQDPLRPGVPEAVVACQRAGITVRMVTGDNVKTARAIALECGILEGPDSGHIVMEGPEFRSMSRAEALEMLPRLRVLARSSPTDKHLLVTMLTSLGEVVAVTGDGTNDAPALKVADIGLAMGSGTIVAKKAANIVIMDDNFATAVRVVRWGRSVFRNIQAFVTFQVTVNVVALTLNMFTSLIGGDIPLTAVQLLWVNMVMDTMGALALATEEPREALMQRPPYARTAPVISNIMWRNILAMAAFQVCVLFVLFFRGCDLLAFGTSQVIIPGHAGVPLNACAGHPTIPAPEIGASFFKCYDRGHGCPPVQDIDGSKFDEQTRLQFHDYITLTCTVFNAFIFMQICNEINARNMEEMNVFRGLLQNRLFVGVILFSGLAQWLIIQYAGDFAQTVPLNWQHWLLSIIIGMCAFPVAAVAKLFPVPEEPPFVEKVLPLWMQRQLAKLTFNRAEAEAEAEAQPEACSPSRMSDVEMAGRSVTLLKQASSSPLLPVVADEGPAAV